MTNQFWDDNYAIEGYKYGTQPNAFVVETQQRLTPNSRILVPGDGEGRNSVWLATHGHNVVAQDGSLVGLEKAKALAHTTGVSVEFILSDLALWTPEANSVDAIVLTYVHFPEEMRQATHRRLLGALRPNGLLILEAFHPEQLKYQSGGPKAVDMLYTHDMLARDFEGRLEQVYAFEGEIDLDEGPGHQGKAYVTRYVGRCIK